MLVAIATFARSLVATFHVVANHTTPQYDLQLHGPLQLAYSDLDTCTAKFRRSASFAASAARFEEADPETGTGTGNQVHPNPRAYPLRRDASG